MTALGCGGQLAKFILITVNVVFIILSIGLMVPGILVQLNNSFFNDNILPLLNQLSFGGVSLGQATTSLSVALIALGAAILILSFLGVCGVCCGSRLLLSVYAGIVAVILTGQLTIAIFWIVLKNDLETKVKEELLSQLINNYHADDLTSHQFSTSWNYLFIQLSCCGVNDVTGTTNDFDNSVWQGTAPSAHIPKSCCGATLSDYTTFSNSACTDTVTSGYYSTGCYNAMKNILLTYSDIFIGIGVAIITIETLAIVSAICVCKNINRVRKINNQQKSNDF
ncbi:tetraspanin-18B-like [Argopecten irradians]|uniref:tetraspanin-18B-like n=1 Tax=Argopecten irradians TaxID=31199 RepID=UPI003713C848